MRRVAARPGYFLSLVAVALLAAFALLLAPSDAWAQGYGHDLDGDSLIEVASLAQLNAIRYDGSGRGESRNGAYLAAFPQIASTCADDWCRGYELTADLDVDTDGNGYIDENDTYWNDGAGWRPLSFNATFEGNGHTISNLYVRRSGSNEIGRKL